MSHEVLTRFEMVEVIPADVAQNSGRVAIGTFGGEFFTAAEADALDTLSTHPNDDASYQETQPDLGDVLDSDHRILATDANGGWHGND